MSWFKRTLDSSIGGKIVVAVSGIALVGFLVAHLSGNLLMYSGREAMAAYAEGLRKYPAVLWGLRIGLIVMAILHIFFTIKLNLANKAARPVAYAKKTYKKASFASRTMVLSGLTLLAFIIFHLAHYTFRITNPEIAALGPWDCYDMLVIGFSNPLISLFYIIAMVCVGTHLSHGVSSFFQTLGLNHHKYNKLFRALGPILGIALAVGFGSIPVAVMAGFLTR